MSAYARFLILMLACLTIIHAAAVHVPEDLVSRHDQGNNDHDFGKENNRKDYGHSTNAYKSHSGTNGGNGGGGGEACICGNTGAAAIIAELVLALEQARAKNMVCHQKPMPPSLLPPQTKTVYIFASAEPNETGMKPSAPLMQPTYNEPASVVTVTAPPTTVTQTLTQLGAPASPNAPPPPTQGAASVEALTPTGPVKGPLPTLEPAVSARPVGVGPARSSLNLGNIGQTAGPLANGAFGGQQGLIPAASAAAVVVGPPAAAAPAVAPATTSPPDVVNSGASPQLDLNLAKSISLGAIAS